ncbi:hypothetical protein EVAR_5572_1 [Eumeta japonica]|uniref:Uncharacterized protein n=1 Tax=Eumeta variegata TaxID=151549 RepID=A0A4C1U1G3_EUMVA|nr:hypothetical protein EVAR_5572_1 [Eumeta japonica]
MADDRSPFDCRVLSRARAAAGLWTIGALAVGRRVHENEEETRQLDIFWREIRSRRRLFDKIVPYRFLFFSFGGIVEVASVRHKQPVPQFADDGASMDYIGYLYGLFLTSNVIKNKRNIGLAIRVMRRR